LNLYLNIYIYILGWYSVTPEDLSYYISILAGKESICIDPFCGSGGNVIQFSKNCKHIYAGDIDEKKIEISKNNCKVYECKDNIDFYCMDFLKLEKKIKADYIFLSPPWGGIEYKNSRNYSLKKMVTPNISEIIKKSLSVAKNIMFYLPRNIDIQELAELLYEATESTHIFFDVHLLESANKLKAILLIYGQGYDINSSFDKSHIKSFLDILNKPASTQSTINNNTKDFKKVKSSFKLSEDENNELRDITKLIRKNILEKDFYVVEKLEGKSNSLKNIQIENKDENMNFDMKDTNTDEEISISSLLKIYCLLGGINFFDGILKYKEKYFGSLFLDEPINSIQSKINMKDLLNFFLKEILTDKQISRLNL
jgi:16S rRNA G966 N2-methylase RsmD